METLLDRFSLQGSLYLLVVSKGFQMLLGINGTFKKGTELGRGRPENVTLKRALEPWLFFPLPFPAVS